MKIPVIERFRSSVAAFPNRTAVSCADHSITFADLDRSTNRLARAYADLGTGVGDLVTIALPNGVEFVQAVLATWKIGAVPQPVSWQLPDHERDQIVQLAASRLVVGVDAAPDGHRAVPAGFCPGASLDDSPLPTVISPHLRAMTSGGSTGRPKLIVATDTAEFDFDRPGFPVSPEDVQLVAGPMYHMAPFSYGVFGVLSGQHVVVLQRFQPVDALSAIARHGVTTAMVVPTMLLRMAREIEHGASFDFTSLKALWHTGGPCPAWVKERWIHLVGGDRILELYGSTEGIATCAISGTEWLTHRGSVGRPIFGELKVLDDAGDELPRGEVGEIYMRRGEGVASPYQYVGAGARTRPGGWESIGDLGRIDPDGYVYLSDRRSDLIVCGGANIYPAEVEAALGEHPSVAASAVVGLRDDELGQRVHAVVQVVDGTAFDEEAVRSFLGERLARYKVPRSFAVTSEPLLNEAGKVRRSAIRDAEAARIGEAAPAPSR